MNEHEQAEPTTDDDGQDARETAGGAATGAIVGTAIGGPVGLAVGAAAGALAGGAAEATDDEDHGSHAFDRTGQPGDDASVDLTVPGQGGHVGGSDPEHA